MSKLKNQIAPPARTPVQGAFNEAVQKDFWHNVVTMVLFETCWFLGVSLILYLVFVPVYLNALKAPKVVVGIVSAGFLITVPMNFLADRVFRRGKRNVWVFRLHFLAGTCFLITGIVSRFFSDMGNTFLIMLFSVGAMAYCSFINMVAPIYWEVLTDNIPLRRRGRFFAARIGFSGAVGFAMIGPVRWVLSNFEGMCSYHVALILGGAFYMLASFCPLLIRDHEDPGRNRQIDRSYKLHFRHEIYLLIMKLWFRPSYRVFIFFSTMLFGSAVLGSFLVTYAQDMFGAGGEGFQANMKMVYIGVLVVGGFVLGSFADRWGFRTALIFLGFFATGAYIIALLAGGGRAVYIAYGLYACAIVFSGNMMTNLSLELMPNIRVRKLAAVMNLFCLPVNLFLPWICGWVLDANKRAGDPGEGYRVVFTVAIVLAIAATAGFFLLVQEPRTGKILRYMAVRRA